MNDRLFKTLEYRKKTATDSQFVSRLGKWLEMYTGNVNVVMRLYYINSQIKELKKKGIWKDTYYGDK